MESPGASASAINENVGLSQHGLMTNAEISSYLQQANDDLNTPNEEEYQLTTPFYSFNDSEPSDNMLFNDHMSIFNEPLSFGPFVNNAEFISDPFNNDLGFFLCSGCKQYFHSKHALMVHKFQCTAEKFKFACLKCDKKFITESDFDRHSLMYHSGKKKFSCNICGKTFSHESLLAPHQQEHLSEKSFACNNCDETFATESALATHERIHYSEKPFGCSLCDKRFDQKSNLKRHLRIHAEIKSFTCSLCGEKFGNRSHLTSHEEQHT